MIALGSDSPFIGEMHAPLSKIDLSYTQVLEGDVRSELARVADDAIQLCVTSPPYNIGKSYEKGSFSSFAVYREWMESILETLFAKLKPGGSLCLQVGNHVSDGRVTPLDYVFTPLKGRLARTSLDAGLIRTASIVAYGLQPLTKRSGTDSLFHIWNGGDSKSRLQDGKGTESDLTAYIDFCVALISGFLNAVRVGIGNKKWRTVEKGEDGILSVTTINSFIILLCKLIEDGKVDHTMTFPSLAKLSAVDFKSYKSSQYADLASNMRKLID